jgi:EAL domain-containing protein (putative c-di-GMP-specific phosphodiesterase class I)
MALLLPESADEQIQVTTPAVTEDVADEPSLPKVVGPPLPSITERVRTALSNDAFELHAQRIAPLHDYSRPERFEVLLRMPDKYGLQTPATFMGAAQAAELMPALDLWVIRHTLSMLRLNNRLGRGGYELSVNLSAASLADAAFIKQALVEIRGSNIKPGQLGFEVAESVALLKPQAFMQLTEQLQAVGCRVTLDNCRSGVGIFNVLPPLSVNCIKIDGSIVREAGLSPATQSLLEAIVRRAAEAGIESVAEHVESQLICSTIISSGFDYAQGFHLEAPAPLAKLFY